MPIEREYDAEKGQASFPTPATMNEWAGTFSAVFEALRVSLVEIVRIRGAGPEFDQLEADILRTIKGTTTDLISLEEEARGVGIGLAAVETAFDFARRKAVIKDDDAT
jgi:hypothetical protein